MAWKKKLDIFNPKYQSAIAPNAQFRASMPLSQHNLADQ
jgi:hypothetical protein